MTQQATRSLKREDSDETSLDTCLTFREAFVRRSSGRGRETRDRARMQSSVRLPFRRLGLVYSGYGSSVEVGGRHETGT